MGQARASQAPRISKRLWVEKLHRRPARWDVLLLRLGEAVARRYWYTQGNFKQAIWRLDAEELAELGMLAAREFGRRQSYAAVAPLAGGAKQVTLFDLVKCPPGARLSVIDQLVAAGLDAIVDCISNYLEIAERCIVRRNHPDLDLLRPKLEQSLRRFFSDECMGEGELVPCLERPAANDEAFFPSGSLPGEVVSGNAALDAYRLNVLMHDDDNAARVLEKLEAFVKSDPMIAPEFAVELVTKLMAREVWHRKVGRQMDPEVEQRQIIERFLFTPGRQGGRAPVQVFLERQLLASERQKQRLERWTRQHVHGVWRMGEFTGGERRLIDVSSGRELMVRADGALAQVPEGWLLRLDVLPWDDGWLAMGTAQEVTRDEEAVRRMLHPLNIRRAADNDDPRLAAARRLLGVVHREFVSRFGAEWAEFASLAELREKLGELHHRLMVELKLEDGRQFADAWRAEVGLDFPAYFEDRVGEAESPHPGVVFDPVHGMVFLSDALSVRMAVQSPFPTKSQKDALARLLLEAWRPGWLVRRLAEERPDRVEAIIRELIGDERFELARDLEALLGRWKCPVEGLPQRPVVFLGSEGPAAP